jgi:hypothetical protein
MDFYGFLWIPTVRAHSILARHNRVLVCITFCCLPVDRAPAMAARGEMAGWQPSWQPVDRSPSHGILLSAGTEAPVLWPEDLPFSLMMVEKAVWLREEPMWCYEMNADSCEFKGGWCMRPCALRCNLSGAHSGAHQGMNCVCRTCYRAGYGWSCNKTIFWKAPTPSNEMTLQPLPADLRTGDQVKVCFISGDSCQGIVVMRNEKNWTYGIKLEVNLFGRAAWIKPEQVDQPSNLLES